MQLNKKFPFMIAYNLVEINKFVFMFKLNKDKRFFLLG